MRSIAIGLTAVLLGGCSAGSGSDTVPSSIGGVGGTGSGGNGNSEAGTGGSPAGDTTSGTSFGQQFEGIYTFDTFDEVSDACSGVGTNQREVIDDSHLVAVRTSIAGGTYLVLASCEGLSACRDLSTQLAQSPTAGAGLTFVFIGQSAAGELTGSQVYYGTLDAGTCVQGGTEETTLTLNDGLLTLEARAHLGDYPAVDGECSINAATDFGQTAPCNRLRTLQGTFVEAL
jgi:hypothetical protein